VRVAAPGVGVLLGGLGGEVGGAAACGRGGGRGEGGVRGARGEAVEGSGGEGGSPECWCASRRSELTYGVHVVRHPVAVEVHVDAGGGEVQAADGAAAEEVHRLQALLQVRHHHVGRGVQGVGGRGGGGEGAGAAGRELQQRRR
jgi:hypothetical protein